MDVKVTNIIEEFESKQSNYLNTYLIKALKDIKRYMKASDEELYQRGVNLTKDDLKKGKIKVLNYLKIKKIANISKVYEYFMNDFDSISGNFAKCDEIIAEYRNEMNIL